MSAGCCSEVFDGPGGVDRFLPQALLGEEQRPWLTAAYYAVNGATVLGLLGVALSPRLLSLRAVLPPLMLGAAVSLPVNAAFLIEIAAPTLLHLPYHHCPYDLVPGAPESMVGVALYFLGLFAVGWACVAAWAADAPETRSFLPGSIGKVLFLGLFGYLGSLVFMIVELALA